jgi:hypothetical protein
METRPNGDAKYWGPADCHVKGTAQGLSTAWPGAAASWAETGGLVRFLLVLMPAARLPVGRLQFAGASLGRGRGGGRGEGAGVRPSTDATAMHDIQQQQRMSRVRGEGRAATRRAPRAPRRAQGTRGATIVTDAWVLAARARLEPLPRRVERLAGSSARRARASTYGNIYTANSLIGCVVLCNNNNITQ